MADRRAPPRPRSDLERVLVCLEVVLAVGAYAGAAMFLSGVSDLGEATARLPFGSLVLAGVALALVNGVLPTMVVVGALRGRPWARPGHLVVGAALVTWIIVQVLILGPPLHPLQGIYLVWGTVILGLAMRLRRGPDPA